MKTANQPTTDPKPAKRRPGGQPGNTNAKLGLRPFERAYRYALEKNPRALEEIARKVVTTARQGKGWAIKELRETVEGRSVQKVALTDPNGNEAKPISLEVNFVKPPWETDDEEKS